MKRVAEVLAVPGLASVRWTSLMSLMALLVFLVSGLAHAIQDLSTDPFARMVQAFNTLSYEGVLVYSHDNRMETLRIVHQVEDGRTQAVMESLNGRPRMLEQDGGQVTCRLPGQSLTAVVNRALERQGPDGRPLRAKGWAPHYLVQSQGRARVAGRQTEILAIIPADTYRYGYRFYLDTETGLPLKFDLVNDDARIIEQVMFTSLTLKADTRAADDSEKHGIPLLPSGDDVSSAYSEQWLFENLPPGFELVQAAPHQDANGNTLEHLVLSDGLADISVYIERDTQEGLEGASRMGAVHAQGGKVAGHQITVVGEVPAVTVAAVLAAIKLRTEGHHD